MYSLLITKEVMDRFYSHIASMLTTEPRGPLLREYVEDEAIMYDLIYGRRTLWIKLYDDRTEQPFQQVHSLEELQAMLPTIPVYADTYAVTAGMSPEEAEKADGRNLVHKSYMGEIDIHGGTDGSLLAAMLPYDYGEDLLIEADDEDYLKVETKKLSFDEWMEHIHQNRRGGSGV